MPGISDFFQETLLNKYAGQPETDPTYGLYGQRSLNARPFVTYAQVFQQPIPATAPTNDLVTDSSFRIDVSGATTYDPQRLATRQYSAANPHIVKYSNIPLKAANLGGQVRAFWSTAADTGKESLNLLTHAIPGKYDPGLTYAPTVFKGYNTIGTLAGNDAVYPWILDIDAGVLTFNITGAFVPANGSGTAGAGNGPCITFWRYEGIFGFTGLAGGSGSGSGGTGNTGPTGQAGSNASLTGATGSQGPTGPRGPNGLTTSTGATGPKGPMGETGYVGPSGPAAANTGTGATGPAGPPGQGVLGATGLLGPTGPSVYSYFSDFLVQAAFFDPPPPIAFGTPNATYNEIYIPFQYPSQSNFYFTRGFHR